MFATLCNLNCLWIFSLNIAFGEHDLFLGYLRIFVQVPGFRLDISPDFQYKNGYRVSKRISGIKRISSIKTDIRYQNGYLVSKRISGIKTDIQYLFWVHGRISVEIYIRPIPTVLKRSCVLPRVTLSLVPSDTSIAETERTPQSPGLDRYGDRFRSSCKQFI